MVTTGKRLSFSAIASIASWKPSCSASRGSVGNVSRLLRHRVRDNHSVTERYIEHHIMICQRCVFCRGQAYLDPPRQPTTYLYLFNASSPHSFPHNIPLQSI